MCGLFSSPQLLVRICIISERVSNHNVGLPLELVGVLRNKNYSLRFLFDSRVIGTERLSNQYSDSVQKGSNICLSEIATIFETFSRLYRSLNILELVLVPFFPQPQ